MRRLLLPLLAGLVLSGCASPGLTRVRDELARSMPEARISSGRSFSFGPLSMGLARAFAGREAAQEGVDLRHIRGVRIGTYAVHGTFDPMTVGTPRAIRRLEARGWTTMVRSREHDGVTWVLYRMRGEEITDLLTASLDTEELALVHVSGDLEHVLREVLERHGRDFLGAGLVDG